MSQGAPENPRGGQGDPRGAQGAQGLPRVGPPGAPWDLLGPPQISWCPLEPPGTFWGSLVSMGSPGAPWGPLGPHGAPSDSRQHRPERREAGPPHGPRRSKAGNLDATRLDHRMGPRWPPGLTPGQSPQPGVPAKRHSWSGNPEAHGSSPDRSWFMNHRAGPPSTLNGFSVEASKEVHLPTTASTLNAFSVETKPDQPSLLH